MLKREGHCDSYKKSIELPLLRVINDFGGEVRIQTVYALVADFFTRLTPHDKVFCDVKNQLVWVNNFDFALQKLTDSGYLLQETSGVWKITPEGTRFLEDHWS